MLVAEGRVLVVGVQQLHRQQCVRVQRRRARVRRAQPDREVAEGFVVEGASYYDDAFQFVDEADQLLEFDTYRYNRYLTR